MSQVEPSEVQSQWQWEGPLAALACLACLIYLFLVGAPAMEWLQAWWAIWLVYLVIPLALTFTLLHGSHIHRERSEAARDLFLLFISAGIFIGIIVFVMGVTALVNAFTGIGRLGP